MADAENTKQEDRGDAGNHLAPKTVNALINKALAIEDVSAQDAGSLGFMARAMVQATLPHRKVEGNEFTRVNGNFTLTIQSPSNIGLPYGNIPRLLMAWVTTEAVKTKERELELGKSMSAFMAELGLTATGGSNGSIPRLKNQAKRLFASTVSANYDDGRGSSGTRFVIADEENLWWHTKNPDQAGLWKSTVVLSERFFKEVIDHPVPIDMRAIKALKQSPMALDIYYMLTHRMSYLKKPTTIPWAGVAMMFGSGYAELRNFKTAFKGELKKVVLVYSQVQAEAIESGLLIRPSLTHIPMKKAGK